MSPLRLNPLSLDESLEGRRLRRVSASGMGNVLGHASEARARRPTDTAIGEPLYILLCVAYTADGAKLQAGGVYCGLGDLRDCF